MSEFVTIGEMLALAQEKLPDWKVPFMLSGAGSEATLHRNRRALDRLAIEQNILVGDIDVDISTKFFGETLPSPAMITAFGGAYRLDDDGDFAIARGVSRDGSMYAVYWGHGKDREEVAAEAKGPLLYQLYSDEPSDPGEQRELIARIQAVENFKGVCLTVDSPTTKRLDPYIETHYNYQPKDGHRFTWERFADLREQIKLPLGLKGVMSVGDAKRAVEHGADFVWLSNHGGRHLDSARATIDLLPEVAEALGPDVPLIVDSGFERGSDVYKAVARGATLVAFGKMAACALAVGGSDGIATLLRIIQDELRIAMAYSGRTAIDQLTPGLVTVVDY